MLSSSDQIRNSKHFLFAEDIDQHYVEDLTANSQSALILTTTLMAIRKDAWGG